MKKIIAPPDIENQGFSGLSVLYFVIAPPDSGTCVPGLSVLYFVIKLLKILISITKIPYA
ncbi:hypothetical protein J4212_03645 [Candidatus Woesearchaeota archaeon]|nr:hypothetical protein [Candidatus Woesearchaeota archaeon]